MMEMLAAEVQKKQDVKFRSFFSTMVAEIQTLPDENLDRLLTQLSPEVSWGDRQNAAKKIGNLRSLNAVPGLLTALELDPFWMVRCTIIQALEKIGDPSAIPALMDTAGRDSFQIVRAYAAKAVERLQPATG
ncbi:MAG: HEAT repeat domain-containing protein [Anaerolineales bacterium]|jgi:HEAT repeat protein